MKRTTINLPDDLAALLETERRRRDVSAATIVREALSQYLMGNPGRRLLRIAALGKSDGTRRVAAEAEEILAEEWGSKEGQNRLMYGTPTSPHDDHERSSSHRERQDDTTGSGMPSDVDDASMTNND